eukprot:Selendium_serpulae@DN5427_c1_g1_i1.p1
MWTAAVAGATAGALHSISGADHIGALLPLCINRRWWSAWIVGFNWGLGHGFGAAVLGLFGFFVKDKLALNAFSDWMEVVVGIVLIVIGIDGLRTSRKMMVEARSLMGAIPDKNQRVELGSHVSSGGSRRASLQLTMATARRLPPAEDQLYSPVDPYDTEKGPADLENHNDESQGSQLTGGSGRRLAVMTLTTGLIHGVAGSGHLLGVIPALSLGSWQATFSYLVAFTTGCAVAMTALTMAVGEISHYSGKVVNSPMLSVQISRFAASVAICVGVAWLLKPLLLH